MLTTNYDACDLLVKMVDKDNNETGKYFSFYPLFQARLPDLSSPYETFTKDDKEFRGISFNCTKSVMELLLTYLYTDEIDLI